MRCSILLVSMLGVFALATPIERREPRRRGDRYRFQTIEDFDCSEPEETMTYVYMETEVADPQTSIVVASPTSDVIDVPESTTLVISVPESTTLVDVPESTTSVDVQESATSTDVDSSQSTSSLDDYQSTVISSHNKVRALHSADPLEWSSSLLESARTLAETCVYEHDTSINGGGYGQNIAAGYLPTDIQSLIEDAFYGSEVELFDGLYGVEDPTFSDWGHFTQIVWKSTTHVACYTADCRDTGLVNAGGNIPSYFTVCDYSPPGNVGGQYADNVGALVVN